LTQSSQGTYVCHRHYFAKKFDHIVAAEISARAAQKLHGGNAESTRTWPQRFTTIFRRRTALSTVVEVTEEEQPRDEDRRGGTIRKLRPDMIRRMDDAPKLVDPNGWISEGQSAPMNRVSTINSNPQLAFADELSTSPSSSPLDQVPVNDAAVGRQTTRSGRLSYV
jgi:hypothetical protein